MTIKIFEYFFFKKYWFPFLSTANYTIQNQQVLFYLDEKKELVDFYILINNKLLILSFKDKKCVTNFINIHIDSLKNALFKKYVKYFSHKSDKYDKYDFLDKLSDYMHYIHNKYQYDYEYRAITYISLLDFLKSNNIFI